MDHSWAVQSVWAQLQHYLHRLTVDPIHNSGLGEDRHTPTFSRDKIYSTSFKEKSVDPILEEHIHLKEVYFK